MTVRFVQVLFLGMAAALASLGVGWIGSPTSSSHAGGHWRPSVAAGERIYNRGIGPNGRLIPSSGGMMMEHSCADCHGLDGHGRATMMFTSPNITYRNLTRKGGMIEPDGSRGMRYTPKLIKRAITRGIDAEGEKLDWTMPRWHMTQRELRDLLAYLKTLR